ncbi:MAG: PQQ-binding-like beta-propeller repeat protein [Pirellulaceae bacterium]
MYRRSRRWCVLLSTSLAGFLLLLPLTGYGQTGVSISPVALDHNVKVSRVSTSTDGDLDRLQARIVEGQWEEALEIFRRLSQTDGDGLILAPYGEYRATHPTYIPLRQYLQWQLCHLPPSAQPLLKLYQQRIDPLVERRLARVRQSHDIRSMEELVEQWFASRHGVVASRLLGEWYLDAGMPMRAREAWTRILPVDAGDAQERWSHPDADPEGAYLRSLLIWAEILTGDRRNARAELDELKTRFPKASGRFAGRTGNYSEILEQLWLASSDWHARPLKRTYDSYGGGPDRAAESELRLSMRPELPMEPVWRLSMEQVSGVDQASEYLRGFPDRRVAERYGKELSMFPIADAGHVYVADGHRIRRVNLVTGVASELYPADGEFDAATARDVPHIGVMRYTLTRHNGRLFARRGDPVTVHTTATSSHRSDRGYLVCLDANSGRMLLDKIGPETVQWTFEGTPVADSERLYVVMRRSDVVSQLHVAAYELATGRLQWRTQICSAQTLGQGEVEEISHILLTLYEGRLYLNSGMGTVACLDCDGKLHWVTKYPRLGTLTASSHAPAWHVYRDLAPCLVSRGRVFAAPSDTEQLLALDAADGRLLWTTRFPQGVFDGVHLIGATDRHLIVTGRRVWWLDVNTGRLAADVTSNPYPAVSRSHTVGCGRAALVGDYIWWPAMDEEHLLFIIKARDGQQVAAPISLSKRKVKAGNLMVAENRLLIAAADELVAFSLEVERVEP